MAINNSQKVIQIKGARVHNLKNISINIPRNKFIVITGVSGSGKSSLAFDTLYAEGQRRYVESLSSYARQFLGRIDKPEVDLIKGIPPAIAIEQKVNTRNPRSTVGTSTEIYDYLKLLFARIGVTYSPVSGKKVKRHKTSDVIDFILQHDEKTKIGILSSVKVPDERTANQHLEILNQQGFTRIYHNDKFYKIQDIINDDNIDLKNNITLVIDRVTAANNDDNIARLGDSIQTAFYEGNGECIILVFDKEKTHSHSFSNKFELDGIKFEEPTEHTFTFNNPVGACPKCEGFGKILGIDEDLVIPNKSLSVFEDAVVCWKGEKMSQYKDMLIKVAHKIDFPIHTPYYKLSEKEKKTLWKGNAYFYGIDTFFKHIEEKQYKIQNRVMLSRYRGKTLCDECNGTRLKKEANYIKIAGKNISELVLMPIKELIPFFNNIKLTKHQANIANRLIKEIQTRLMLLHEVGLDYLTLNRLSSSLSGGESQRINLATSLGSNLVGSLYILDEPSIGLHSRDTFLLIKVLKRLQKMGNTVVVVEHDEDIMRAADKIIDLGPGAGRLGGKIVFNGTIEEAEKQKHNDSFTCKYLTNQEKIDVPLSRRAWNNFITIEGATENNLKNINVKFPLNIFTVITGVSGSGKSSLVKSILYPALKKHLGGYADKTGSFGSISGSLNTIEEVEFVDQNPIGKSSRSNAATYLKAYDDIRKLMSNQQASKINGFKPSHFSFNTDGGRCEACKGEGTITIEMQFMSDIVLTCNNCKGKRFKQNILDVKYRNKNIHDILETTVEEAITFFSETNDNTAKKIVNKLKPLADVGLEYLKLGQASSTLSGGESQRIKLASFLSKESNKPTLFIFDEPTTGLHFHDIKKLLNAFNKLISKGNSIIIIEHNPEIIKSADWIIDLGPEGGKEGGNIVFEGTPEELIKQKNSYTAKFMKKYV